MLSLKSSGAFIEGNTHTHTKIFRTGCVLHILIISPLSLLRQTISQCVVSNESCVTFALF